MNDIPGITAVSKINGLGSSWGKNCRVEKTAGQASCTLLVECAVCTMAYYMSALCALATKLEFTH